MMIQGRIIIVRKSSMFPSLRELLSKPPAIVKNAMMDIWRARCDEMEPDEDRVRTCGNAGG